MNNGIIDKTTPINTSKASRTYDIKGNIVQYTTPGSYTWKVPDNCIGAYVTVIGGGGGGTSGGYYGSGGGAGGVSYSYVSLSQHQLISIVVGGGGGGGGNGGTSSFGSLLSATGGTSGNGGGSGGSGSGGSISISGSSGSGGYDASYSYYNFCSGTAYVTQVKGGDGAALVNGLPYIYSRVYYGGGGAYNSNAGGSASGLGCGGGSGTGVSGYNSGGSGFAGAVIIDWISINE